MFATALLSLSMQASNIPFWVPSEFADESKYEFLSSSRDALLVNMVNKANGCNYIITVKEWDFAHRVMESAVIHRQKTPPSQLPFGQLFGYSVYGDGGGMAVETSYEKATFTFGAPLNPEDKSFRVAYDFNPEARGLEALLRESTARFASRRLGNTTHFSVGDFLVKGASGSPSGTAFVSLVDLSEKANFPISPQEERDTMAFSFQGKKYKAVLGASSIEVDEQWVSLPDLVMMKDNSFYIPAQVFSP